MVKHKLSFSEYCDNYNSPQFFTSHDEAIEKTGKLSIAKYQDLYFHADRGLLLNMMKHVHKSELKVCLC